jgi:hypothetical protein
MLPPNLDHCLRLTRWTAWFGAAVLVAELLILLIVDSSATRCPGWMVPHEGGASHWLWLIGAVTVLPTIFFWNVVFRWDHYSKMLLYPKRPPVYMRWLWYERPPTVDTDMIYRHGCVVVCLIYTVPLWAMVGYCTDLPRLIL